MGNRVGASRGRIAAWLELAGSAPSVSLPDDQLESVNLNMWALSPERVWYMGRRAKVFTFALLGGSLLLLAAAIGQPPRTDIESWWAAILAALSGFVLIYATFPYWTARRAFNERRRKMASYRAQKTLNDMLRMDPITLPVLFTYNRRQLDAYQEESRNQQRAAFRLALFTAVVGFGVLLTGILISYRAGPGTEAYIAAGLSAVGAAISAYVVGTLLRLSRRTDEQLNRFYIEPHMMGRLLLAERLAGYMSESSQNAQRTAMIEKLLTWPLLGETSPEDVEQSG